MIITFINISLQYACILGFVDIYFKVDTVFQYEDTFDDYLEMFIQYGYVILFSSAFPLAALCALLNNFIEIRTDAFKLCLYHQRPFGRRVQNIGIWQVIEMCFFLNSPFALKH